MLARVRYYILWRRDFAEGRRFNFIASRRSLEPYCRYENSKAQRSTDQYDWGADHLPQIARLVSRLDLKRTATRQEIN
jgi:hypothetical protein